MIIYGWQQLEGIKENVLRLVASDTRRDRRIISPTIPKYANGKRLSRVEWDQFFIVRQEKFRDFSIAYLDRSGI